MRLIHLANYPNRHPGSYIPLLLALFDGARERGWEVEAGFPAETAGADWLADFSGRGIPVHLLGDGGRRQRAREVRALLGGRSGPLVVHTHFTTFDVPATLALRSRADAVLFWHIHTVLRRGAASVLRNSAKFALFGGGVDRIVVPAANIGDGLAARRARRERIMLLPSPVDPAAYTPASPERRARARAALGIPEDAQVLLHIGRAWRLKGGDRYLQAVRQLLDEGRPLVAITLRGGEEAERDASELGLGDSVRVLPRVEDIRQLYDAGDCFVAPSRGEGMPFSIVEALSSGVPVVASDLPGHRYLGDRLAACTITATEPAELAASIAAMLDRPAERVAAEAVAAREWIAAHLSLTSATATLLDAYDDALAARGLAPPQHAVPG